MWLRMLFSNGEPTCFPQHFRKSSPFVFYKPHVSARWLFTFIIIILACIIIHHYQYSLAIRCRNILCVGHIQTHTEHSYAPSAGLRGCCSHGACCGAPSSTLASCTRHGKTNPSGDVWEHHVKEQGMDVRVHAFVHFHVRNRGGDAG